MGFVKTQSLRTVPRLKDLIYICLDTESQGHGITFNMIYLCSKYPYIFYIIQRPLLKQKVPALYMQSDFHFSVKQWLLYLNISHGNLGWLFLRFIRNERNFTKLEVSRCSFLNVWFPRVFSNCQLEKTWYHKTDNQKVFLQDEQLNVCLTCILN